MADVFVVIAHTGMGEAIAACSTYALAAAVVGTKPSMGYSIAQLTIDGDNATTFPQQGTVNRSGGAAFGLPKAVESNGKKLR